MILPILFLALLRFAWVFRDTILAHMVALRSSLVRERSKTHKDLGVGHKSFLYRDIRFNDDRQLVLMKNQEFTVYKRLSDDTSLLQGANIGSWNISSMALHPDYSYQFIVRTNPSASTSTSVQESDRIVPIDDFLPGSERFEVEDVSEWLYNLPKETSTELTPPNVSSISLRMT